MSMRGEQQSTLTVSRMLGMSKADCEIISQGAPSKEEEKSSAERKLGGASTVSFGRIPQLNVGYRPEKRLKGTSKTPRKATGKAIVLSIKEE